MGPDLGRAVPVRRPTVLTAALLAAFLAVSIPGLVAAGPATADPTPAPPSAVSTPSISPPSQQQIDDARLALDRLRKQGTQQGASTPTTLTQVAGPTNDAGGTVSRISDEAWWTLGAGLLVLLVISETTRLSVRRAKHRRSA